MTVGAIAETEGSGKNRHTNQRTISAVAREDAYVQLGEPDYPTYIVRADNISIATSADHILQIMADGTGYTRLLRYWITFTDDRPASDLSPRIILMRTTTAGTGGTAFTSVAYDLADTYAGGMMTLPTAKGTENATLHDHYFNIPTAFPASAIYERIYWEAPLRGKPIIFGTAVTAGLVWKIVTGIASATISIHAEISVTSYL